MKKTLAEQAGLSLTWSETTKTGFLMTWLSYEKWFILPFQKWAATWQNQQSGWAPSEDSDQPGHPPSLIRVFAVRMKKAWVLSYPLNAQRRLWSDWADAQADLSLRWAHSHFVGFVMRRLKCRLCYVRGPIIEWMPGSLLGPGTLRFFSITDKGIFRLWSRAFFSDWQCFFHRWRHRRSGWRKMVS